MRSMVTGRYEIAEHDRSGLDTPRGEADHFQHAASIAALFLRSPSAFNGGVSGPFEKQSKEIIPTALIAKARANERIRVLGN